MKRVILTLLSETSAAPGLLGAAERLAGLVGGARINVVGARLMLPAETSPARSTASESAHYQAEDERRCATLHAAFAEWERGLQGTVATTSWVPVDAGMQTIMDERSCYADFIVVARPATGDDYLTQETFRLAMFESGRPVLAVPPNDGAAFGHRIAVAWRGDKYVVRAVRSALDVLDRAEQLYLLAGVRGESEPAGIHRMFAEHEVQAELHVMGIVAHPFGKALLDRAHELGADMLVMGAYVQGTLRQMLLGGVTGYMLAHADIPLLMHH